MCGDCTPDEVTARKAHNDQAIMETNAFLDESIQKFKGFKVDGADKAARIERAVTELTFLWNHDRLDESLMISVLAIATDRLANPEDYAVDDFWGPVMGMPTGDPMPGIFQQRDPSGWNTPKCDYCGKPTHYGRRCS